MRIFNKGNKLVNAQDDKEHNNKACKGVKWKQIIKV